MNLKEYAEKNGMTLDEAKKQTGLTHWKQEVVENLAVDPVSCEVIQIKSKQATVYDVEVVDNDEVVAHARSLQGCIGQKTPAYLQFVNDNKNIIRNEYELCKHLIERYIC